MERSSRGEEWRAAEPRPDSHVRRRPGAFVSATGGGGLVRQVPGRRSRLSAAARQKAAADDFEGFFRLWEPQVCRYLCWLEADRSVVEDAAQETMLSAYTYWGSLRDYERPQAWLFKVARQRLNRMYDTRNRHVLLTDPADLPHTTARRNDITSADQRLHIIAAVRQLPDRQREAVALRWQCDLSYRAIGEVMGITEIAARAHVHQALKRLRTVLHEDARGGE